MSSDRRCSSAVPRGRAGGRPTRPGRPRRWPRGRRPRRGVLGGEGLGPGGDPIRDRGRVWARRCHFIAEWVPRRRGLSKPIRGGRGARRQGRAGPARTIGRWTETSSPASPTGGIPSAGPCSAVALLVLVPGPIVLPAASGDDPSAGSAHPVGKPAPAFELETVDGGTVRIRRPAGKPYVDQLLGSVVPPCRVRSTPTPALLGRLRGDVEMLGA